MGNTKSNEIERCVTVAEINKMAVPEIEKHNGKHFAYVSITRIGKKYLNFDFEQYIYLYY